MDDYEEEEFESSEDSEEEEEIPKEKEDKKKKNAKNTSSTSSKKKAMDNTPKYPFKKPGWKNPNCQMRGKQRYWPHLKQIIQFENYSRLPTNIPTCKELIKLHFAMLTTYLPDSNIETSFSVIPKKKYCDVTGLPVRSIL